MWHQVKTIENIIISTACMTACITEHFRGLVVLSLVLAHLMNSICFIYFFIITIVICGCNRSSIYVIDH